MKGVFVILFLLFFLPLFSQDKNEEFLLSQISGALDDTSKVKFLLEHSTLVFDSNLSESKISATDALGLAQQLRDKTGEANSLYQLALIAERQNDYKNATHKLEGASKLFSKMNDFAGVIRCLNGLGLIYVKTGEYDKAIEKFQHSIKVAEKTGDRENISLRCYDMGIAYQKQNNVAKALESFNWALDEPQKHGDQSRVSKILNSIGLVYLSDKQYEKAIENFNQSLEIKETLNDKNGAVKVLHNLGSVYNHMGECSKLIYFYEQSIKLSIELGQESKLDTSYLNIGVLYGKMDSIEKSLEYLKRSITISEENGNKHNEANCYDIIGSIYHKMGDSENAIPFLLKSVAIAGEIDALDISMFSCGLLAKCYANTNNFKKAYTYHIQFKNLSDSLSKQSKAKEVSELKSEYELALQNKESKLQKAEQRQKSTLNIVLAIGSGLLLVLLLVYLRSRKKEKRIYDELATKNQVTREKQKEIEKYISRLKEQKADLVGVNKSKDKLFSIIGHDLRGPVGLLDSVLDTIFDKNFELEQNDIDELLKSIQVSTKSAVCLLENLLYWANSQKGTLKVAPIKCNLYEIAHEAILLHSHFSAQKDISIEVNIEPGVYVWCDPDMLKLIFRNLVSNALKFSFEGGKIEIWSKNGNSVIEVSVVDYGVGIDINQMRQIFKMNETVSTRGTANESGSGIGLSLCAEFARKNKGRIWAESVVRKNKQPGGPGGSIFRFTIPAFHNQTITV